MTRDTWRWYVIKTVSFLATMLESLRMPSAEHNVPWATCKLLTRLKETTVSDARGRRPHYSAARFEQVNLFLVPVHLFNETLFYVLFKILFTASNVQGDFSRIRHRLRNHCSARKNYALSSLFLRALFKNVGDALLGRNVASVGRRLLEEIAKRLPFKHTSCSCNTKGLVLFSFLSDSFDVQRPLASRVKVIHAEWHLEARTNPKLLRLEGKPASFPRGWQTSRRIFQKNPAGGPYCRVLSMSYRVDRS